MKRKLVILTLYLFIASINLSAQNSNPIIRSLNQQNISLSNNYSVIIENITSLSYLNERIGSFFNSEKEIIWKKIWFQILIAIIILASFAVFEEKRLHALKIKNKEIERLFRVQKLEIAHEQAAKEMAGFELKKIQLLTEKNNEAFLIMDANGNVEWINETYTRIFGYDLDELIVAKGYNIVGANTPRVVKRNIEKVVREKKTVNYELKVLSKAGKEIWIRAKMSPVLDKQGEIIKLIAIDSDISAIKELEESLEQQKDLVKMKTQELQDLKLHFQKNHRLESSIQERILPQIEDIPIHFESLIYWQPKDLVSGDYYWFSQVQTKDEDFFFVCIIDSKDYGSTGILSLMCERILHRLISEQKKYQPKEILDELQRLLADILEIENAEIIDVVLCRLSLNKTKAIQLKFSGNRPLYIYQNSEKGLLKLDSKRKFSGQDKTIQPIFKYEQEDLKLDLGDILYLTSDGYIHQNNKFQKEFGIRRFTNLINVIAERPMDEQELALDLTLKKYQGSEKQWDDVTIIGLKVIDP